MRRFKLVLGFFALVIFFVSALHLVLGVRADVLLGAQVPAAVISDPTMDSQNRFYGVFFTLSGLLLLLGASDVPRYAPVLRCVLWVFLAAGLARLVSIAVYGFPPAPILALLAVELVVPPALVWWLSLVERRA